MVQFQTIPSAGGTAIDELAWADEQDVLIAITCAPFREEVVTAVKVAREQGMTIVAISDSPLRRLCELRTTPSSWQMKHPNSSHRLWQRLPYSRRFYPLLLLAQMRKSLIASRHFTSVGTS